jgi:hypothetical protein
MQTSVIGVPLVMVDSSKIDLKLGSSAKSMKELLANTCVVSAKAFVIAWHMNLAPNSVANDFYR